MTGWVNAELAKEGHVYEPHQYFLRSVYRALRYHAAPLDAQVKTTDRRVRNPKDVPVLRSDHISIESMLRGVW